MKKICFFSSVLGLAFLASLQAQNSFIDTVTITAPDPDASETGPDPGRFEIRRTGPTNFGLAVFYRISGTASNGVDYEQIPNAISIPQGSLSVSIPIKPIDDALAEGNETVVLQIVPSPLECPSPACGYDIGSPSNAAVTIADNDSTQTNQPPISVVTIFAVDPIAVEGEFCLRNWWWTASGNSNGWTTTSPAWRTNYCVTNTASFAVRRSGDTNSDLTVYYAIGGTASNGVDYVTLPGQATIPAGHRAARIVVVPIDDNIVERIESVLLSLQTPTDSPPAYVVGYPSRAAAIILDNDRPRPPCGKLSDGLFHLCVPGTNGYAFCVRASSDLGHWTSLCTNVVNEGAVHFVDPDAPGLGQRFYQVQPVQNYSPPE